MAIYHGNKEFFCFKRQMLDEARMKLDQLPVVRIKPVFVYEWRDNDDSILGFGCDINGDACVLKPNIKPGLFVVSNNFVVLSEICTLYNCVQMDVFYDFKYDANNFSVFDLMGNYDVCQKVCLVKISTRSVSEAEQLHNKFKYNTESYKFVGISQYFNITQQIMFELLLKERNINNNNNNNQIDSALDNSIMTTMCWFDENLMRYPTYDTPTLPLVTFDIETVSSDPHRVPTGDAADDILFTVSIHHTHTNILYTLVYLPLQMSRQQMTDTIMKDEYDIVPDKSNDATINEFKIQNVLECFDNERDLLIRTMELITLRPKLHVLCGYNSLSYDIKYLLLRCVFYNLPIAEEFVWREGFIFGSEQVHMDLFRIFLMRYRFKSYTLNDVSREIIKESKTGVSAVRLRYTFFRMIRRRRYFYHNESNADFPSIKDTLEYNNADTLLVSKLEAKTRSIQFFIQRAQDCQIPVSHLNTNYNKMQYKLLNECFVVGLRKKSF